MFSIGRFNLHSVLIYLYIDSHTFVITSSKIDLMLTSYALLVTSDVQIRNFRMLLRCFMFKIVALAVAASNVETQFKLSLINYSQSQIYQMQQLKRATFRLDRMNTAVNK